MAFGGCFPLGSRVRNKRMGKGSAIAIPAVPCRLHRSLPFAVPVRVRFCQTVADPVRPVPAQAGVCRRHGDDQSCARCVREGAHGYRIESASRDQRHLLSIGMQTQFQHTVAVSPISRMRRSGHRLSPLISDVPTSHSSCPLAQPFTHFRSRARKHKERKPSVALSREVSPPPPSRSSAGQDCSLTARDWKAHYRDNAHAC